MSAGAKRARIGIAPLHIKGGSAINLFCSNVQIADSYKSSWDAQNVYGRMDPIAVFKNTQRSINISFIARPKVTNLQGCRDLTVQVDRFVQYLYPSYLEANGGAPSVLKAPPFFKIKFYNLISSPKGALTGFIQGLNVQVLSAGNLGETVNAKKDPRNRYPKDYSLSFTFVPLHEHKMGWYGNKFGGGMGFPYRYKGSGKASDAVGSGPSLREASDGRMSFGTAPAAESGLSEWDLMAGIEDDYNKQLDPNPEPNRDTVPVAVSDAVTKSITGGLTSQAQRGADQSTAASAGISMSMKNADAEANQNSNEESLDDFFQGLKNKEDAAIKESKGSKPKTGPDIWTPMPPMSDDIKGPNSYNAVVAKMRKKYGGGDVRFDDSGDKMYWVHK
jgi:hypothetical protein